MIESASEVFIPENIREAIILHLSGHLSARLISFGDNHTLVLASGAHSSWYVVRFIRRDDFTDELEGFCRQMVSGEDNSAIRAQIIERLNQFRQTRPILCREIPRNAKLSVMFRPTEPGSGEFRFTLTVSANGDWGFNPSLP